MLKQYKCCDSEVACFCHAHYSLFLGRCLPSCRGGAARSPRQAVIESMVPLLDVRIVLTILSCIGNILIAFALLYAVGTAVLLIWPHTLLKVANSLARTP